MKLVRLALLASVPVAPILHYGLGLPGIWVLATGIVAVSVLADRIRAATEQLVRHTGPAVGGLLTISLGSLTELLLAQFVLAQGWPEIDHGQITGFIIGTSPLGPGLATLSVAPGGSGRPSSGNGPCCC